MKSNYPTKLQRWGRLAFGLACGLMAGVTASASPAFLGYSAGDTTSTDVTLWTRAVDTNAPAAVQVFAQLTTDPAFNSGVFNFLVTTVVTNDYTAKVQVTQLQPATRYYYRFTDGVNATGIGTFKTAPAANVAAPVQFAFSGDNDGLMRPYALASTLPARALDFFVNLGDTMYENASALTNASIGQSYTNSPSVTLSGSALNLNGVPVAGTTFATRQQLFDDYNKKYRENFLPVNIGGQAGLQPLYSGQGVYTLYDNHEFGNRQYINGGAPAGGSVGGPSGTDMATGRGVDARDNGTGNVGNTNDTNFSAADYINRSPGFLTLQQVYLNYQPIADRGLVNNPADPRTHGTKKLYFAQQWGKNALFVNTDTRAYRDLRLKTTNGGADDTGSRADNTNRTMLGVTQLAWLKQTLLSAQAAGIPWKFVAVSSPIDQIGPVGGSLAGVTNSSGNVSYSPSSNDGGKSWIGGYRAERNDLLKFIADNGIQNVVFLAADDHQNRINEVTYSPSGQTGVQATYVKVPSCFSIVAGPLGATGPDLFLNHDFASIKAMADSFVTAQLAAGVEPFGLQGYPGLTNVVREGDANASTAPSAVDFYSPDTFNYVALDVSADGKMLTVSTYGITAPPQNSALEYNASTNPVRQILSFQVPAALPVVLTQPQASFAANPGGSVTLSANVSGATSYQWHKDGVAVPGANGATLVLNNVRGGLGTNHVGPSTVVPPTVDPLVPGYGFQALFSVGETVNTKADGVTPYRMVGIPDGLGAFDNNDGTFTLLMNHELGSSVGINRTHGGKGAFVSRWLIRKSDLAVLHVSDLVTNLFLWNGTTHTQATAYAMNRLCSADLAAPSAYFNAGTGRGSTNRIFLSGEEGGKEGKVFAHLATGPDNGKSYELPYLGKIAWENAVASPFQQNKTIVMCMDDSGLTDSRVHVYIGTKSATGLDIDKAGLSGGTLYGIKLNGFTNESNTAVPPNGTAFSLFSFGNVSGQTGTQIEAQAVANGVATFQRVEDGAWDPNNPRDYYFVTTANITGNSRLWRLRFADIANPENGGIIDLLMTGTEGHKMFDNIGFDADGNLILQEDPGNNAYLARMWKYVPATGAAFPIATFRPSLFTSGQPGFLTQDEESSGIIDVTGILGYKAMLFVAQIHTTNGIPAAANTTEVVENGQLLLMRTLDNGAYTLVATNANGSVTSSVANVTVSGPPAIIGQPVNAVANAGGSVTFNANVNGATSYQWHKDGVAVPGANGATLVLNNVRGGLGTNHVGPSTVVPPTVDPLVPGYGFQALFSVGETVNTKADGVTPYRMVGIPDGLGAFDNNDGTFTLLMNHELGSSVGINRTHGGKGAFVSRWLIRKSDLAVLHVSDLVTNLFLWNGTTHTQATAYAMNRLCSADLAAPSAYFNAGTGRGSTNRIFLSGEEGGKEGKVFAHLATGPDNGKSYELPYLGKIAWENAVASPFQQNKTIVMCMDDSGLTDSRVHVYIGTKSATGLDIDKAGLSGGTLYGIKLNGFTNESNTAVPPNGTAFSLFSFGNVSGQTGTQIEAQAVANGVATFQRVEDGAWDPNNPRDYYFVTTANITGNSRLWRLRFADIANPENGGIIDLLMTGTEGHKMFDNIGFDADGNLILQEDPGNNAYLARMWKYVPATGAAFPIATFRPSLFTSGQPGFLTQDEESSGIIDVTGILGYKAMLFVAQIHTTNGIPAAANTTEVVENGQLLLMRTLDNTGFTLVASNAFGAVTSVVASVSVTTPPRLADTAFRTALPGATAANGGTLTLTVPPLALSGTGPFTFQWFLNNTPILNATNGTLVVPGFNASFAGSYTVQVGNGAGTVTSQTIPVSTADIAFFGGVAIDGPANAKYRIEFLNDVTNTNSWTTLTNVVHSGGRQFYMDTTSSGTQRRFFRAVPTP
jgi:phosphodiesterase/alkaline phosphatase D-like protein